MLSTVVPLPPSVLELELELLLEELLDEPELLPELELLLEELLEELPLLLPEELEPPLLPPPPPPQAVNIETAMTAARATAAILFDNLMIEFLLFFDSIPKQKPQMSLFVRQSYPPATLSRESNNFVGFCKNLHFTWCNMTNTHLADNTKGPPVGRP